MIYIQYTYAIPSAIIVSSLLAYERMELNGISKNWIEGLNFSKISKGQQKEEVEKILRKN